MSVDRRGTVHGTALLPIRRSVLLSLTLLLLLLLLLLLRRRLCKALRRSLLLLLRGLLRLSCRQSVDTHSISDPLRNIWVLNRQVENDDDLLALHHIADVAIETDAAVYLQGSVVNQLILLRPEAL